MMVQLKVDGKFVTYNTDEVAITSRRPLAIKATSPNEQGEYLYKITLNGNIENNEL